MAGVSNSLARLASQGIVKETRLTTTVSRMLDDPEARFILRYTFTAVTAERIAVDADTT